MSIPTHVVAGDEPIERESWIVAAEIDFGDSGAPLVDHDQRVIAIAYGTIAHGPDVTYAVGADRLEALMVSSDLTTEVDVPTCG
jgi:S1-C subfamily serine protease